MAIWSERAWAGQVCDWCGEPFAADELVLIEDDGCRRHDHGAQAGCSYVRYLERLRAMRRTEQPSSCTQG